MLYNDISNLPKVTGGLHCGQNTHSWYTRISPHMEWITCIVEETQRLNNQKQVQEICNGKAKNYPEDNLFQ